ncbi:hypothetical protein E2F43_07560 [Seongchinamella unica]|uniref:Uncharacterized protein n=1 Tax=Seongchinamella unica TaxID=2547392 RepID=A0A4R5LRE1_9GAMM|nr:hypothetical protein [Seongchinamella unica]TDG13390.1 hypothetical protein E2F43_07560 [Seongchinamella unica]
MAEKQFEYGPVARGVYMALLYFVFLVGWLAPGWLFPYAAFLIFLGLGLRPLLEWTGLAQRCQDMTATIGDWRYRKRNRQRRMEIARRERDRKYRYSHYRDPRLPPNW